MAEEVNAGDGARVPCSKEKLVNLQSREIKQSKVPLALALQFNVGLGQWGLQIRDF